MSKKEVFLKFFDELCAAAPSVATSMPDDAKFYLDALRQMDVEADKPLFTENGKIVLKYLQEHPETAMWKARDIAEGLFVSSRTVSGACRKLANDNFIEKLGQNPTIYTLTEKGKTIVID